MKQYTLEELKQTQDTTMKFLISKRNATIDDLDEARKYYKKNSKNKVRTRSNFCPSRYKKQLLVFNNSIK